MAGITTTPAPSSRDYPLGSPIRAQLEAAERAANLRTAEAEMARARQKREEIRSLGEAQRREKERQYAAHRAPDPQGWNERIGDLLWRGIGKTMQAFPGALYDLVRAPVREDIKVPEILAERGGQLLGGLFGPRGVGGSLIGLIPPQVRAPIAEAGVEPVTEALAATRREVLIEPLTRVMTGRQPFGGLGDLSGFDDPTIPNTVGRAVVSWWDGDSSKGWGQVVSGGIDVVSAMFLDPAALAGGGAAAARREVLREAGYGAVRNASDLAKVVESKAFGDFTERAVAGKTGAQIYNELLPNHPNGLAIGTALEEAGKRGGVEAQKLVVRSMLGDADAAGQLARVAEDAAVILDNTSGYLDGAQEALRAVRSQSNPQQLTLFGVPTHAAPEIEAAVAGTRVAKAEATRELVMAKRAEAMYGQLDRLPRQTVAGRIRTGERMGTRSDWYQNSPYARPLHVVFDRNPKNRVNLNNPTSAADLNRMLNMARMSPDDTTAWLNRYGAAANTAERRGIFEGAESAAIQHMAERAGLSIEDVDELLTATRQGRRSIGDTLSKRIYGGSGRDLLVEDVVDRPLTQIHIDTGALKPDEFLLQDFHQVRRVVTKWGQFKANHPTVGLPVQMLHEYNDLWRLGTVAKVATSAVIQMDQTFRIYMKLGALTQAKSIVTRGTRYLWDTVKGVEDEARGLRPLEYRGVTAPGPWGVTTEQAALTKALNSSRGVQRLMDSNEIGQRGLFGHDIGARTIYPSEASHPTELAKVLNDQIGGDPVNRMLLEGRSVDDAVAWLEGPEGRAYTKSVPFKRRDPRGWVEARAQHIEDMTGGSPELRALALERKVSASDIEVNLPDPATRPMVNRLLSDNMTARSSTLQAVNRIVDGFFRVVQSWPDDVLSRNTLYSELYTGEMRRMIDVWAGSRRGNVLIPDATLAQFSQVARTKALATTKNLLYDLADQSRAAEIFRFAVPFFEPVREQVTVFGQLIGEAPQRYFRAKALLRAPLRAGYIYDENGNQIGEDGRHRDPLTGEEVPENRRGDREMLRFNLPTWTRSIPYFGEVLGGRTVTLDVGSVKLGLPTSFGFGPMLQIPVNQTARQRPDLEESLKFLLPFGTTDASLIRQLEPGWLKKWNDAANRDEDNRTLRGAEASALLSKLTDFRMVNGRVPTEKELRVLEKEAIDEAQAFMKLRFGVTYLFPFAVGFDSPYKPYADAYRAAQQAWMEGEQRKSETGGVNLTLADADGNERDPTQWFLDTFGDEFYAMTQSVTRSVNGVPPTIGGAAAEKKYRDLIEAHPDLGGLIVGSKGAGEFNRTVYQNQLGTEVRPGADEQQREVLPLSGRPGRVGISTATDVELGWHDYMAGMDLIDAERKKRGLPNLQVKGAQDLAEAKRVFIEQLKADYPAWRDEFEDVDEGKWRRKVAGLEEVAADKRLQDREEIRLLGVYLEGRRWIQGELDRRQAKTLTAKTNMDLALRWESFTSQLVDSNLAFADVFHRYLENDPVVVR